MKHTAKRRIQKWFSVRAAALTFLCTLLIVYGVCVYIFQDFVFIDKSGGDRPSEKVVMLAAENADVPMNTRQLHREGPSDPLSTVYNGVVSDASTLGCARTALGYTYVSYAIFSDQSEAERILTEVGISWNVEEVYASVPAGTVQSVTYAGYSVGDGTAEGDGLYCNPDVPVTLHVGGKKPADAADGEKKVYITFDDGPSAYTPMILRTLARYGAKATFFTLGKSVDAYPETAAAISAWGNLLASHGYAHDYEAIYASVASLEADIIAWESSVQAANAWSDAQKFLAFRFPGGSRGQYFDDTAREEMFSMLHGRGYSVYDWNVLTNDGILFQCPDDVSIPVYLQETFLETWSSAGQVKVILMHDSQEYTAMLLPYILRYCISEGYTFATLDEMNGEFHY